MHHRSPRARAGLALALVAALTVGAGPSPAVRDAADVRSPLAAWARPTDRGSADAFEVDPSDLHSADTAHFRVHFTDTGVDRADIGFVKRVMASIEAVWRTQVEVLGWPAPRPDDGVGGRHLGGHDLIDVYLLDLDDGPYGYAAADEDNPCTDCRSVYGYLVLENDYVGYDPSPDVAMRSTAAHEFAHLVQMGMAWDAEPWAYEATAVWLERVTYPALDARTLYLTDFADRPDLPLTEFAEDGGGFERSYGAYVWNLYLAETHGQDIVRQAWQAAAATDAHIMAGYATALRARGVSLDEAFTAFSAATSTWEVGGFPGEPAVYPTVHRSGRLSSGDVLTVDLDHLSAELIDLDVGDAVTVTVRAPRGTAGGVSITASGGGSVVAAVDHTLFDGEARAHLSGLGEAGRVTLVVVNAAAGLTEPKQLGSDVATYLADDVPILLGVDVDPGVPPKR